MKTGMDQLLLSLALSETEQRYADSGTVCPQHKGTTLEVSPDGVSCAMCDLDERYNANAPAKRWWEFPVAPSPRPLPIEEGEG